MARRRQPIEKRLHAVPSGASATPGRGEPIAPGTTAHGVAASVVPALLMARGVLARPLPTPVLDDLRTELAFAFQASVAHPAASMTRAARVVALFVDDEARAVERARDLAADANAAAEGMVAATVLSNLAWARGRLDEGLRWGRDAVARVCDETPPMWAPYPALALAAKLVDTGDRTLATALVDDAVALTRQLDVDSAGCDAHLVRARLLLAQGDAATAQALAGEALALAGRVGADHVVPHALLVLATAAMRLDDVGAAREHIWRCRLESTSERFLFPCVTLRWGEFLVASDYLPPDRAAALLTSTYADLLSEPLLMVEDPSAAPWLTRIALSAGDVLLATTVVAAAERVASDNPGQVALSVAAAHAKALVQDDVETLRYVAGAHRDAWAAALARDDAYTRIAQEGAQRAGLSTVGDNERVTGLAALTETEQRIAELVADGMTNRQVGRALNRSPHTVNYHLRRIFRKLGVTSRVELAKRVYRSDRSDG